MGGKSLLPALCWEKSYNNCERTCTTDRFLLCMAASVRGGGEKKEQRRG